ncbi:hypothetical protein AK812_SmicGene24706 [Symbiodinium microadriaticum]|uniref:Uncharacterized protein n=1 Tax=Symbiodinium microadriaticum TaxID=2951 RepID=A0A1Q9DE37_SYMMI|nr:hypothetical protein AK812_SmicGene24706 [Symbiodinium microadriaticum]
MAPWKRIALLGAPLLRGAGADLAQTDDARRLYSVPLPTSLEFVDAVWDTRVLWPEVTAIVRRLIWIL